MARKSRIRPTRVPASAYRLQFNREFTFQDATRLIPYLHELGVTDIYASPFLMARPGSMHGYDISSHCRINPEIGTREDFNRMSDALRERGMGLIADVVPNHMGIDHASNEWWCDVMVNGPSS